MIPRIRFFVKEMTRQAKNTWTRAAMTPWNTIQDADDKKGAEPTYSESRLF